MSVSTAFLMPYSSQSRAPPSRPAIGPDAYVFSAGVLMTLLTAPVLLTSKMGFV